MVSRVIPRGDLESETFALAARIAQTPRFGLALANAVNQCEDQTGLRNGMESVFGLHHYAHAHNAAIGVGPLGGVDAATISAPVPRIERGP